MRVRAASLFKEFPNFRPPESMPEVLSKTSLLAAVRASFHYWRQ